MPTTQCPAQGRFNQRFVLGRCQCPSHHTPAAQIEHDRQIEPSLVCPPGWNVTRPFLIRTARRKILMQQLGCHSCPRLTFGGGRPMMPTASRQSPFSHEARPPLAGARDALSPQLRRNAWTPIHLSAGVGGFLNVLCEVVVLPLMHTHRTFLPGLGAAQRHPKRFTQDTDRIVLALVFHHLIPHSWPGEKILTVFFRRSRSCRVLSSSRFRRRFSSSNAV